MVRSWSDTKLLFRHTLEKTSQRARSQISAVSFEARPAGSAAVPSRSVDEESALSAADAEGPRSSFVESDDTICLVVCCERAGLPRVRPAQRDPLVSSSVSRHQRIGIMSSQNS